MAEQLAALKEENERKKRKVDETEAEVVPDVSPPSVKLNDDGESYFELSHMRRMTLRKFKGQILIDIREFYGNDKPKPGKKGISLSLEQFKKLRDIIKSDEVDAELQKLEQD